MTFFDHTYTKDHNHRFLNRLEKMGFQLSERLTNHPGGHRCRFIYFEQPQNPTKMFYLEFIHVLTGGEPILKPGLSLGSTENLKKIYEKFKKDRLYKCRYSHRNYDWKRGDTSHRPGWNFVNFNSLGFRGLYPWFTQHEPLIRRNANTLPKHANGVIKHIGFEMELNEASRRFFTYMLDRKLKPTTKLRSGTELYINDSKRTRINAIILKCENLDRFVSKYKPDEVCEFQRKKAARIINPSKMWDIIVV